MRAIHFSLILPTYNRGPALRLTLERLQQQAYPTRRWEVIIVDDGSSDDTGEILREYERTLPLRWFRQDNAGASAARNRALREADGLFALFIDDDVLAPPQLLQLHQESHGCNLRTLVRGPVINFSQLPPPPPPNADQLWRHFSMNYLCTSNASLLRENLLEAGLFDETLERWEDAELGVRLKRIGIRRIFNSQAYVLHYKPPESWEARCRTAARDGRSAALLYRRYPSARMWLRSGLHALNDARNRMLLQGPARRFLSASQRERLELERIYLDHGHAALKEGQHAAN